MGSSSRDCVAGELLWLSIRVLAASLAGLCGCGLSGCLGCLMSLKKMQDEARPPDCEAVAPRRRRSWGEVAAAAIASAPAAAEPVLRSSGRPGAARAAIATASAAAPIRGSSGQPWAARASGARRPRGWKAVLASPSGLCPSKGEVPRGRLTSAPSPARDAPAGAPSTAAARASPAATPQPPPTGDTLAAACIGGASLWAYLLHVARGRPGPWSPFPCKGESNASCSRCQAQSAWGARGFAGAVGGVAQKPPPATVPEQAQSPKGQVL